MEQTRVCGIANGSLLHGSNEQLASHVHVAAGRGTVGEGVDASRRRARWWRRTRTALKRGFQAAAVLLGLYALTMAATWLVNCFVRATSNTVVFSNGYDTDLPRYTDAVVTRFVDACMYPPITLRQNLNGNRVDWFTRPTRQEVMDRLAQAQYENVVFIGHGTRASFGARDGSVTSDDIVSRGIPKKPGAVLQHTCCGGEGMSLQEALLIDHRRGYGWNRRINSLENYGKAVRELFNPQRQ